MPDADAELEAGRAAFARGAFEEARESYRRALAEAETPQALEGIALASFWLVDAAQAFWPGERAYSLYRKAGDAVDAGRVAFWLALGSYYLRGERSVALGWLERASRLLEAGPPSTERAWVCLVRAHLAFLTDHDLGAARALVEEVKLLSADLDDVNVATTVRAQDGLLLVSTGQVERGMRLLDEATTAAVAGELDEPMAIMTVCCYLIYACKRVYDFERAAEWCRRTMDISERYADRVTFAACRTHYADVLILQGSWADADVQLAANVQELAEFNRSRAADGLVRLAELRRRQGQLDEAEALADEAEPHSLVLFVRAALALDREDGAGAADLAERALRRVAPEELVERVHGLDLLLRAQAALGETEAAAVPLAELESIASVVGSTALRATAALAGGLIELAGGDADAARRRLEDAVDLYQESGAPFEAVQARTALADALARSGRGDRARAEARRAYEAADQLGARHEAGRALALLRQTGGGEEVAAEDGAGLTRREREVLRLIVRGRSNQEIATELVLSVRTVERHIANIYDKIGAAGKTARATATAYALGHGLG
jgi:ATP/maltotriose-dependent transcriptional regulator MalT